MDKVKNTTFTDVYFRVTANWISDNLVIYLSTVLFGPLHEYMNDMLQSIDTKHVFTKFCKHGFIEVLAFFGAVMKTCVVVLWIVTPCSFEAFVIKICHWRWQSS